MLEVADLSVRLQTQRGPAYAIRNVSFSLQQGDTLGLVGESGCGKSITAMALLGLLPENAEVTGSIRFDGQELVGQSDAVLRTLRGNRLGMIFQEPMTALNPVHTIGDQVAEPMRLHRGIQRDAARSQTIALLERVGIHNAAGRVDAYPHQFSGGQRQRIALARALAAHPELLVCDEPVSALDVAIQAQILNLMQRLQRDMGLTYLFISHDLGVVRFLADTVAVMYLGMIVECGPAEQVFTMPRHPYTRALIAAVPIPDPDVEKARRGSVLKGEIPDPTAPRSGCPFASRCPHARQRCTDEVPLAEFASSGHEVACHFWRDLPAQATSLAPHSSP